MTFANKFRKTSAPKVFNFVYLLHLNIYTLRPKSRNTGIKSYSQLFVCQHQLSFLFVILVTHPFLYGDDGSPRFRRQTVRMEVRTSTIVKIPEFF